ncbi:hypothetical protein IMG5_121440 [Ichthyophthirius multifiliis]|uniref:Transmembrane protein n=1 Tax=Ichthyophthirius multifiliis TaxID=5932 RepID=G0QV57_ICHMU|nr:hypothetical protein IMG5_121440 [Ichthyophthirius multifiliis]EGR30898.1 hypothetical protein IMG5_121440 [Ichthyophthirius multifiliis]|eukprot:XP_004032485.1 hypothetical protein IMG5_121440 [Ichthyophthirius multifiliis]
MQEVKVFWSQFLDLQYMQVFIQMIKQTNFVNKEKHYQIYQTKNSKAVMLMKKKTFFQSYRKFFKNQFNKVNITKHLKHAIIILIIYNLFNLFLMLFLIKIIVFFRLDMRLIVLVFQLLIIILKQNNIVINLMKFQMKKYSKMMKKLYFQQLNHLTKVQKFQLTTLIIRQMIKFRLHINNKLLLWVLESLKQQNLWHIYLKAKIFNQLINQQKLAWLKFYKIQ